MRIVILGNGLAGVNVAQCLRKLQPDPAKARISIFGREAYDYYARIRLPEVFSGSVNADDLRMYPASWYRDRSIELKKGVAALGIDRKEKSVSLSDGSRESYDKLVLAVGADGAVPPIPGVSLAGVKTVREYDDADWVRVWIGEGARSVSVVGGGLLGLEAAKHLAECDLERVNVIEIADRLLPRQLDRRGAAILQRTMEGFGLRCITGAKVKAFHGHSVLESISLESGDVIESDAAILSMGNAPRLRLAAEAGILTKRGVLVDEGMRSSDPDVYAVGDVAEFQGIVWGIIPAALEQAPVAAARILGDESARYAQTVPRNILKVAGVDLLSAGKAVLETGEEAEYEILVEEDLAASRYRKIVLKEGRLAGVILMGDKPRQNWFLARLGKELPRSEIPEFPSS